AEATAMSAALWLAYRQRRDVVNRAPVRGRDRWGARVVVLLASLVALVLAAVVPGQWRADRARRLAWRCDGPVVRKYESSNHLAPTVDVRNADGSVTTMQGLDPAAFG